MWEIVGTFWRENVGMLTEAADQQISWGKSAHNIPKKQNTKALDVQ